MHICILCYFIHIYIHTHTHAHVHAHTHTYIVLVSRYQVSGEDLHAVSSYGTRQKGRRAFTGSWKNRKASFCLIMISPLQQ